MPSLFLGGDVSKGYADFVVLDSSKNTIVSEFQLDDTFKGHCALYDVLGQIVKECPQATIYAAVESTGGYENNWINSLSTYQAEFPLKWTRLNPYAVYHSGKAGMDRVVTDAISARTIAEYLITHSEKINFQQEDLFAGLRRQWKFISTLTQQKNQLTNQLESLVYGVFPELLSFCKQGFPQWILKLLSEYSTAKELAEVNPEAISRIPYITHQKAKLIVSLAQESVASSADQVTSQLVQDLVKQIIQLNNNIQEQIRRMTDHCSLPEVELLKSFPGINDYTAIGLILFIGSVKRFANVKKLSAFFGLHPAFKISGDGKTVARMSKKGNTESRKLLFMITFSGVQHNPLLKQIYQNHIQKGMSRMAAIGACMHKTLRIIYGMLKHNQTFNPEIDHQNRKNSMSRKQSKAKNNNSRRYQDHDQKAPVSRRQAQKRKEQVQSQNVQDASCGITIPVPDMENHNVSSFP